MSTSYTISVVATAALVVIGAGCDSAGASTALHSGEQPSGLVGDDPETVGVTDTDTSDREIEAAPGAMDPLEVTWTDGAEVTPGASLSLSIANTTDRELSFEVAIVASGVIGSSRTPMGEHTLLGGESLDLSIDAEDLPIKSASIVSSLAVELTREIAAPGGTRSLVVNRSGRMYRHLDGYDLVRTYTQQTLEDDLGGLMYASSATDLEDVMEETLGVASDGAGSFDEVEVAGSALVLRDGLGEPVGLITRVKTGVSDMAELDPAAVSASDSDSEEVEAGDE